MTHREKRLAKIVGGVVAIAIAYPAAQKLVIGPFQSVREELSNAESEYARLMKEVKNARRVKTTWTAHTERHLSLDAKTAELRFLDALVKLLNEHELTADRTISPHTRHTDRKTGFIDIPVLVRVKAKQKSVISFLQAFYRQPYYAQIVSITLRPEETRAKTSRSRRNRGTPAYVETEDTKLSVTFLAKTVVLPKQANAKNKEHDPDTSVPDTERLAEADLNVYAAIAQRDIFRVFQERPPVRKPAAKKDPEVVDTTTVAPTRPTPLDPRKDADRYVVVATEVLDGQPRVFVRDGQSETAETAEYFVNDAIENEGTVILIHRTGVVVRAEEGKGESTRTIDYFYRLGSNFKEREPVDPSRHPEVSRKLQLARRA